MPARRDTFVTVHSEGALLPPDFLQRVAEGHKDVPGLRPADYHLQEREKLSEAITRSWNRLLGFWAAFQSASAGLKEGDAATGLTRDKWLLPFFQELGYGRLPAGKGFEIDGKSYPISHVWQNTPIHLLGRNVDLDRPTKGVAGAAKASPHGLVQEFLNRHEGHLWGFLSNGLKLRILRDNKSLTRQAYVEFDLAGMMDGQVYSDFALVWLLCHQSRVEAERAEQCWLEKWADTARQRGTRALDQLRDGVQKAIEALGRGFLTHSASKDLVAKLRDGSLDKQDYYRQLLRIVYRLIFLFVAEDRDLLLTASPGSRERDRYQRYYSGSRLRTLADRRRGSPHPDLWEGLRFVFAQLSSDTGCADLGLPALASFLWSDKATPHLDHCELANADLLDAVRSLAFTLDGKVRRVIDYRNLGAEELGSVYESLLELHPDVNADAPSFQLKVAAGHERKTTGSYYTPTSLIECLLDSALEPLVQEALKQPDPEKAILDLKVCDPACGSGHFLIAAAHRMANRLAAVRTGDEEPSPSAVRKALRDIVGRCLYGVDINPMAVELCKVNLWLEALEPGKPLSFLEHHIQCGNSLLGATPALMRKGIPDEAFEPLEGDDKAICRIFKKKNKAEREGGQGSLLEAMHEPWDRLRDLATALADLDAIPDDTPEDQRAKEEHWEQLVASKSYEFSRLSADAWCAAFMWKKVADPALPYLITDAVFLRTVKSPREVPDWLREEIARLAGDRQFFHWHLAFPGVFRIAAEAGAALAGDSLTGWLGGFDLILGNPPWDTLSPDQREFFGTYVKGLRAMAPPEQQKEVDSLLERPSVAAAWSSHCRRLFGLVHFLKNSGVYTLYAPGNLGKGDFNTYRPFVELALRRVRSGGFTAMVVPGGLYGGANASAIRQHLLDACDLRHLYGLINTTRGWFEQVDIDRFAAFAARRGGPTKCFRTQFGLAGPEDLSRPPVEVDAQLIRERAPETYAIPDLRDLSELAMSQKMYAACPAFGDSEAGPPFRHYQAELHMGSDRDLFTTDQEGLPVYEGRMVDHFDHRAKTYESGHGNSAVWVEREFGDPAKGIAPQWRVLRSEIPGKLGDRCDRFRVAFCDVANPRNERSFTATLVPPGVICGHKVPTFIFPREDEWAYLPWLAVANSFTMDWLARTRLSSPAMTFSLLDSLPFPRPDIADPLVVAASPLVLRLVCTAPEMTPFWNAMAAYGFVAPVHDETVPADALLDPAARAVARAYLDAQVARDVFGLSRPELSAILDSFQVVKRRDEALFGVYRTKDLVMAAFDAASEPHEALSHSQLSDARTS